MGNGTGFSSVISSFAPIQWLPDYGSPDTNANQLVDINDDGLDDWVNNDNAQIRFRLNNGNGWNSTHDAQWTLATSTISSNYFDRGMRFIDINGDGLKDFVRSYNVPTYLSGGPEQATAKFVQYNTGSGWTAPVNNLPGQAYIAYECSGQLCYDEMWDWSGDGLADSYEQKNTARKPDMLSKITFPTGGSKEVTYTPTTQQYGADGKPKHVYLPYPIWVVTKITTNDGKGNLENAYYSYENGDLYYNNPYDRKIGGFEIITENKGNTLTKTYYHQGNAASTTIGEVSDHFSKIGKTYREDVMASSTGELYKRTFYNWDNYSQGGGRHFVSLTKTMEQSYDGDADHKDKGTSYTYDTSNGNLLQRIDWGEVTGSSDGTFSDTGSDRASTTISYVASSSANMWLPKQETTVDQSLTKVKETKNYYDTLAHGSVGKGNETKRELWVTGSSYIDTEKTYNTYGLVTQEKDPRDKATNYTYDAYNLYPASTTNPLSHITGRYYDYSSGKPTTVVEPNGRTFQTVYDALDRVTEEKQPDQTTPSTLVTKATYAYTDNPNKNVLKTNYLDGSITALEYSYFDGLDRPVQTRKEAEDTNTFSVSDRQYDSRGLLWKESLPYFSSGTASTSPTGTAALYTTYTYDPLDRPTTIARVTGSETRAYDDWKTTTIDPNGNQKDLVNDAYGNLTSVVEYNDAQTYTTAYEWNRRNDLTKITDAASNIRNFTYDGLSRRLTAEDLHASGDGTFGSWSYTYDNTGNMTQLVSPRSQTVNYTYDDLNRPLTEDFTGGSGTEVTYGYDTCADGKGRLCTATTTAAVTNHTYNALGLAATEKRKIDATNYTTSYTYDRQGNATNIIYPDNSEVKNTYNTAGLLEKVEQKAGGGSFADVVSDLDYAPTGAVAYKLFANGVASTYTYDANELYRLKNIHTAPSGMGGSLENLILGFGDLALAAPRFIADALIERAESIVDAGRESLQALQESGIGGSLEDLTLESTDLFAEAEEKPVIATSTLETRPVEPSEVASFYAETPDTYEFSLKPEQANAGEATIELRKDRPEVRLTKWNGEVDLGISYGKVAAAGGRAFATDRIEWNGGKEEVHAYPLEPKEGMESGGLEVEVVLNEKPDTNTFDFSVDGAEDLDFSYQSREYCAYPGVFCSEHVVGSYAVYHKTKKDHTVGDIDYATGKAFHIYRPKIVDASGSEVWGAMLYRDNVLSVMVPQEFLEKATYPVKVDPTFGYTSMGASDNYLCNNPNDGLYYATRVGTMASSSSSGTITSVSVGTRHDNTTESHDLFVALNYRDTSSVTSHDQITSGETLNVPHTTSATFKTIPVTEAGITAGTNYVVNATCNPAGLGAGRAIMIRADSVSSEYLYENKWNGNPGTVYADVKETPWTDDISSGNKYSIYATYSVPSEWSYRKKVTVGGATGAGTNYQVLLKIGETSGASGEQFDLGGHSIIFPSVGSGGDLKFTKSDGTTALDFWVEDVRGSAPNRLAYVWVKVPDDLGTSKDIYVYYGNPGASNLSNGFNTFPFFDNFDDGVINGQKWTTICTSGCHINGGGATPSTITESGGTLKQADSTSGSASRIVASTTPVDTSGYAMKRRFRPNETITYGNSHFGFGTDVTQTSSFGTTTPFLYSNDYQAKTKLGYTNGTETTVYNSGLSFNTWYRAEARRNSATVWEGGLWSDAHSSLGDVQVSSTTSFSNTEYPYFRSGDGYDIETDWVLLRKYKNPEPAFSSAASEEPVGGVPLFTGVIQDISYTYDANGNITNLADHSDTGVAKTVAYGYDDLNRLMVASTTAASSSPYRSMYGYSSLGSLTSSRSGTEASTTYSYAGTGYINPHAPTTIGTTTYAYDNAGNLTSSASTTYTWDYRNRLTALGLGGATTTYGYDHTVARVFQKQGSAATTTYANKYFSKHSSTSTEYIYAGGDLIATKEGNGTATTTRYLHSDHLASLTAASDSNGGVAQAIDYFPYGSDRINENYDGSETKRTYIGQFADSSGLSYLNARYYDGARGQFTSQDPVFWEVGQSKDGRAVLPDPQLANSYSYARANPIINKDPLGRFLELSGSLIAPGRAWSAGIRLDSNGFDYFLSGGVGVGLSAGVELMWAPEQMLPHSKQASVSVSGTVADGIGGRISQDIITYASDKKKTIPNAAPAFGIVIGGGVGSSVQLEGTAPIPYLVWDKPIAPSRLGSTANIPATISSYKGTGASSYLTQTYVTPNGKTTDWYGNIAPTPSSNSSKK